MISDFIDEHNGYLQLTDEEYERAKKKDPTIRKHAYCKYNIISLHKQIISTLETVTLENIQNYFRKVRHYISAYLEGLPGGSDLEKLVKN